MEQAGRSATPSEWGWARSSGPERVGGQDQAGGPERAGSASGWVGASKRVGGSGWVAGSKRHLFALITEFVLN